MIKNIGFTILITILFTTSLLNFPKTFGVEVSEPSMTCPITFYIDDDDPDYSYTHEYFNGVEALYCLYDGQTLLLESFYYTYTYSDSTYNMNFLLIYTTYNELGVLIQESYMYVDEPIVIKIYKIYDGTTAELISYNEQYILVEDNLNPELHITNEIFGLDYYNLLENQNIYERFNEIMENKSLD